MKPALPDHAREDHVEIFEFYYVGKAIIDKIKVLFPVLSFSNTNEGLGF